MRRSGSPEKLRFRRIKAAKMLRQGKSLSEVAHVMKVSTSSVHRWKQALARSGLKGLECKRHPGPKRKLSPNQRRELKRIMTTTALRYRYGLIWFRCKDYAKFIQKRYRVTYHPGHISRLLRSLGLSDEELVAARFNVRCCW